METKQDVKEEGAIYPKMEIYNEFASMPQMIKDTEGNFYSSVNDMWAKELDSNTVK